MRASACWLVACCLTVGAEFCARQYELLPDIIVASWLWHAVLLFLVAASVARFCLTRIVPSRGTATAILLGGHLAAMAFTYAFLTGRVHCGNISTTIDYRLRDDTGAFILLGPSLALALASYLTALARRR